MSLPKPYYQDSAVQIFHGRCEQVAPFLDSFDILLTDPPYGIGEAAGKNKSRGKLAKAQDFGNFDWDNSPPETWLIDYLRSKAQHQIIFGGNYFTLPPSSCWLVWDKVNGDSDFADCELAWTNLKKAVRRKVYRWAGMLQEKMGAEKEPRFHPTQKPLDVMTWAISQAPDTCRTILDPFMGVGTTLVAAKLLGRKATGIEMSEAFCETAAKRMAQEVLGL